MGDVKTIRQHLEEFLVYKKALGYVYDSQGYYLKRYTDYVTGINADICCPEKGVTDNYLKRISGAPGTLYATISSLREFSRYLHMHGITNAYIVPPKSGRQLTPEPPYFFTQKECEDFFKSLDTIEKNRSFKGRELVMPALFRLLYCCGLRCKEARTLKCENVHLEDLYIDILQSKGLKSRRIFITPELAEYLVHYDHSIKVMFPKRTYFFPHKDGCYKEGAVSSNFKRFWKKAYPDFIITTRPRAYDFRYPNQKNIQTFF